ncbi:MAG: hypothetical protein JW957_02765 [Candidatus Omnitrophica bacterium]|nr:hypothetical protein [Candidatus Omnitrophota bacterium]
MKKIMMVWALLFTAVFVNAEVNREELFMRIANQYGGQQEVSGEYEINMLMMGATMKIPVRFWKKHDRMRMDMEISGPGMPQPMESVMVIDSEKMIQYQKALNTVIKVDMSGMSSDIKNKMSRQQSFFMPDANTVENFRQIMDQLEVEEKTKDGKNFYLITVRDIDKMGNFTSMYGGQGTQQFFKKSLLWLNQSTLFPEKMEFYGEGNTPGMWIDFLEIKTDTIDSSVFNLNIPSDAKVMDMTEAMKSMMGKVEEAAK